MAVDKYQFSPGVVDFDPNYVPDRGDIALYYSASQRKLVGVSRGVDVDAYSTNDRVNVDREYDGSDAQKLQSALSDHAGQSMRNLYLRDRVWLFDEPVLITGQINILGPNRHFGGAARISCSGDFSAFIIQNGDGSASRVELWDLMFYNSSESTTYFGETEYMVQATRATFFTLRRCYFNGHRLVGAARLGLRLIECDQHYLRDVKWINWNRDSTLIHATRSEVTMRAVSLECYPGSEYGLAIFEDEGSDGGSAKLFMDRCQIERTTVLVNCPRAKISAIAANAQGKIILGPRAFHSVVEAVDGESNCELNIANPVVSLANISCGNAHVHKRIDLWGNSAGKPGLLRSVEVEASSDYLIAVQCNRGHVTQTNRQIVVAELDVNDAQTALADFGTGTVTIPEMDNNYYTRPSHVELLHVMTSSSAKSIGIANQTDDNWDVLRAYKNLIPNGRFMNAAGDFDETGWTFNGTNWSDTSIGWTGAQVPPQSTLENHTDPSITVTATAGNATVTASASVATKLRPGMYLYHSGDAAWRKITNVSGTTITLASGHTSALSAEPLTVAWGWTSWTQDSAPSAYRTEADLTDVLQAGKHYLVLGRFLGTSQVRLAVGQADRGDAGKIMELNLNGGRDLAKAQLPDGSWISTLIFTPVRVGLISFGYQSTTQTAPILCKHFGVYEIG